MAITTYSELLTAGANWLERGDMTLRLPEFVSLAEARINRRLNKADAEEDTPLVGVPGSRFISLPANFDNAVQLWLCGVNGRVRLTPVSAAQMDTSVVAGSPQFWAIDNGRLAFERQLDAAYSFALRETTMLGLSVGAPTNDVLTQWPDLYLNGMLAEAAPYMLDDERMTIFEPKFVLALAEVSYHASRNRARTTLCVDLDGLEGVRRFRRGRGL
jgi:hypothetical protein